MKTVRLLTGLALLGMICLAGCSDSEVAESDGNDSVTPESYQGDFNPAGLTIGPEVGNLAPEIEGEDLDGVPFKLSDYRGKVVMLDFYGDW